MYNGAFGYGAPQVFVEMYKVYSMTMHNKEDKEGGDKIILPVSAFEKLAHMTITYPMQFELRNEGGTDLTAEVPKALCTHVGVLEFTAPEGKCFVPYWIMQNLLLQEGSFLQVKNVTLPLAQFIKFRPQSEDFLEISNPKAVLESTLRNFSCVTKEDTICLPYNGRKYYLDVVDVKPQDACSIVEADVKVDFEPPPGYEEKLQAAKLQAAAAAAAAAAPAQDGAPAPAPGSGAESADGSASAFSMAELAKAREARKKQLEAQEAGYLAFSGSGRRVDGKKKGEESNLPHQEALSQVAAPVATARKGKWKSKTKGSSFAGAGHSLS